jgi:hypothetical protein
VAATAEAANGSAGHVLRRRWSGRSNRCAKRGRPGSWTYAERVRGPAGPGPGECARAGPARISVQGFAGHFHKKEILSPLFTANRFRSITCPRSRQWLSTGIKAT